MQPKTLFRLADVIGMMAFYPLMEIVSTFAGAILMLVVKLYYSLLLVVLSYLFTKLDWSRGKAYIAAVLTLASAVMVLLPIFVDFPNSYYSSVLGTILPMFLVGLMAHDLSKKWLDPKLDRMGGLVVLGSFLLVVRADLLTFLALIVIAAGLSGVSQRVRLRAVLNRRESG